MKPSSSEKKMQGKSRWIGSFSCGKEFVLHIFPLQSPALDCTQKRHLPSESETDKLMPFFIFLCSFHFFLRLNGKGQHCYYSNSEGFLFKTNG